MTYPWRPLPVADLSIALLFVVADCTCSHNGGGAGGLHAGSVERHNVRKHNSDECLHGDAECMNSERTQETGVVKATVPSAEDRIVIMTNHNNRLSAPHITVRGLAILQSFPSMD